MVSFRTFRVDLDEERVWNGTQPLAIRRKPFAILRYLLTNPHRLVTHAELLEHVWGNTVVSESTIRSQVHELRQLLGEGVIETVIGRGYRFTAPLSAGAAPLASPAPRIVGRDGELAQLQAALERARGGHRQVCIVTGEPGIGKTTLVDAFLAQLPADVITARGHAVEQHGTPEPYLPILEILRELRASSDHGARTLAALVRFAPVFLAHHPQLAPLDRLDDIRRSAAGGTESRMVRELLEALEELCAQHVVVLVLEDLQWSDVATLDLLALLGVRRERANLLVIATSRRGEANTASHPVQRVLKTLVARHGATGIPLDQIASADLHELLALRFGEHALPAALVDVLLGITAGTPLFVVTMIDDLVARGMIAEREGRWTLTASLADVRLHRPDSVKQLIDIRLDRLDPAEQRVLEAASLVGAEFSPELVGAALGLPAEDADEICDGLARRALFLRRESSLEWPDGTLQTRYAVTHGLVQEVCLARGLASRHQRWHRAIAEHLEQRFGEALELAQTIASHHERAGTPRAVHFYVLAAERTASLFASRDAIALFRRGVGLLRRVPESRERDAFELRLLAGIVASHMRVERSDDDRRAQLERMIVLARRLDDGPRLCAALLNLEYHLQLAGRHDAGAEIAAQLDELIAATPIHPTLAAFSGAMRELNALFRGKRTGVAAVFQQLLDAGDSLEDPALTILGPTDRRTVLTVFVAIGRWFEGDAAASSRATELALARARTRNDPFGFGFALCNLAWLALLRDEPGAEATARALANEVLATPDAVLWQATAMLLAAPLDAPPGDLAAQRDTSPLGYTRLALVVARALERAGRLDEARSLVAEALAFARDREERIVEPELVRLA